MIPGLCFCLVVLLLQSSAADPKLNTTTASVARVGGYEIVHAYPHDPNAYTQGLIYKDGHLYESTGREGKSSLRMVDLATGQVLQRYDLPSELFGEGLTDWDGNLIQLTWTAGKAFVYDSFTFSLRHTFRYKGEGWGLTHDAKWLIMSDGTSTLRFLDPTNFHEIRRVSVLDENKKPVINLNELEYVQGQIYANVWQTDQIVRISPQSGKVLGWIDLTGLMKKPADREAVLNGIAYDDKADRLFVTGKLWPKLFEVRVVNEHFSRPPILSLGTHQSKRPRVAGWRLPPKVGSCRYLLVRKCMSVRDAFPLQSLR